jgi:hypothetical protein
MVITYTAFVIAWQFKNFVFHTYPPPTRGHQDVI